MVQLYRCIDVLGIKSTTNGSKNLLFNCTFQIKFGTICFRPLALYEYTEHLTSFAIELNINIVLSFQKIDFLSKTFRGIKDTYLTFKSLKATEYVNVQYVKVLLSRQKKRSNIFVLYLEICTYLLR